MNGIKIPCQIENKLCQLNDLVKEYPEDIPPKKAAEFLGMDVTCLRESLSQGRCPFGFGWQKNSDGNRAFKIPTVTFYLWYTHLPIT